MSMARLLNMINQKILMVFQVTGGRGKIMEKSLAENVRMNCPKKSIFAWIS